MVTDPHCNEPQSEPGSFRERLSILKEAIPGAASEVRPLLSAIYRSARHVNDALGRVAVAPVLPRSIVGGIRCFDCGMAKMESFHSSKQGGYHLCPACFHHRVHTGRAKAAQ
jgi:hypothetical protein